MQPRDQGCSGAFTCATAAKSQHSALLLCLPLPPPACPHPFPSAAAACLAPQAATAALSRGSSLCGTCGVPSSHTRWTSHAAAAASSAERLWGTLAAAAACSGKCQRYTAAAAASSAEDKCVLRLSAVGSCGKNEAAVACIVQHDCCQAGAFCHSALAFVRCKVFYYHCEALFCNSIVARWRTGVKAM